MKTITESNINNFMSGIDFKGNWTVNEIKQGIQKFTGELPGVQINYKKDISINEIKGEVTEVKKVDNIEIVFTDLDNRIKRLSFNIL